MDVSSIPDQEGRAVRGDNHVLAVTTTTDEVTGEVKPLFYFPVQVCKATDEREVKFDIAAPSGAPRKQVYTDSNTGEVVEDAACLRGVRIGDEFHAIDAEAIEQINAATKIDTMVALGTVPMDSVPTERATGIYFIQSPAKGGSPKSYRILYDALRADKKAKRAAQGIVVKRTARTRQKLGVIYADTDMGCLMMLELRFASALKQPDEQILAPQAAQVEQAQIDVARKVVDGLGDGMQAIETEQDDAQPLKASLIEQAVAGETLSVPTPVAETAKADDLTAMLEASLAAA